MKVNKAVVIKSDRGADVVMLHTNFPSSMPNVTSQNLIVKFDAAAGSGEEYVNKNFPDVEVFVVR